MCRGGGLDRAHIMCMWFGPSAQPFYKYFNTQLSVSMLANGCDILTIDMMETDNT